MALELLEYFGISIASAVVLIVLAKFILQHLIRKNPDYYDKRERKDEAESVANFGKAGAHEHHEPVAEPEPVAEASAEPEIEKVQEEPKPEKKSATKKSTTKKATTKKAEPKKSAAKKTANSGRKPSMNMKKDELISAAEERGIKLPEKVTKAQILELIKQAEK